MPLLLVAWNNDFAVAFAQLPLLERSQHTLIMIRADWRQQTPGLFKWFRVLWSRKKRDMHHL
eukprot:10710259-Karenia_brevis.AAC.1